MWGGEGSCWRMFLFEVIVGFISSFFILFVEKFSADWKQRLRPAALLSAFYDPVDSAKWRSFSNAHNSKINDWKWLKPCGECLQIPESLHKFYKNFWNIFWR